MNFVVVFADNKQAFRLLPGTGMYLLVRSSTVLVESVPRKLAHIGSFQLNKSFCSLCQQKCFCCTTSYQGIMAGNFVASDTCLPYLICRARPRTGTR